MSDDMNNNWITIRKSVNLFAFSLISWLTSANSVSIQMFFIDGSSKEQLLITIPLHVKTYLKISMQNNYLYNSFTALGKLSRNEYSHS
jgi:hypothetical protein